MAIYTVKAGDTLSSIAKKLGYSNWQDLYNLNKSVIGSNPNLIRSGAKLTYGSTTTTPPAPTPTNTETTMGTEAGEAQPTDFGNVLSWESYFDPTLARNSAEQLFANYYAPIAQQRQSSLESDFANRNLTRSGIRGQGVGDLYREMGQEHQSALEADVLQQQQMAREDYERLRELYESSSGSQRPTAGTTYNPYQEQRPRTDAGTYGSSYLDWLNKATRT